MSLASSPPVHACPDPRRTLGSWLGYSHTFWEWPSPTTWPRECLHLFLIRLILLRRSCQRRSTSSTSDERLHRHCRYTGNLSPGRSRRSQHLPGVLRSIQACTLCRRRSSSRPHLHPLCKCGSDLPCKARRVVCRCHLSCEPICRS